MPEDILFYYSRCKFTRVNYTIVPETLILPTIMILQKYPFYLKLTSTNTWFRISDDHTFTEVKTLGDFYSVQTFSDDILPMRNHISDLAESEFSEMVTEISFNEHLAQLEKNKTKREF